MQFFHYIYFFNAFIFGCAGSLKPRTGLLQLRQVGNTLHCRAGIVTVAASLAGEPRLEALGLQYLQHVDFVVVAHRRSCSEACGILPDQGLNPCPLHWQADSHPPDHQGRPRNQGRHTPTPVCLRVICGGFHTLKGGAGRFRRKPEGSQSQALVLWTFTDEDCRLFND